MKKVLFFSAIAVFLSAGLSFGQTPVVTQDPLPYPQNALEPHISSATLGFHYGKHHAAYVEKAKTLVADKQWEGKTLEAILTATAQKPDQEALFNNLAQAVNHAFFWNCLKPNGGGQPTGKLLEKITADFGSFEKFREQFENAAKGQFGSGWAWLVLEGTTLKIVKTGNADTPLAHGQKPLFTVDVWEHAYYLDYQNRRADFVKGIFDHLANWDFVAAQLGQ